MKFEDNDLEVIDDVEEETKVDSSKIEKEIDDHIHKELDTSKLLPQENNSNLEKVRNKQKRNNLLFISSIVGLSAFLFGMIGGYAYGNSVNKITDPDLIKIIECYETLSSGWYYGKTQDDVTNIVTDIMINSFQTVDKYTFVTPSMSDQNLDMDGTGLGVETLFVPDGIMLTSVYSDGTMAKKGAQKGDVITKIKVDDTEYELKNKSFKEISEIASSAMKKESTYYIDRNGVELEYVVSKSYFNADTAWLVRKDNVDGKNTLTIRIDSFLGNPYDEVVKILDAETKIDTLIIDLRNNTGGYLNQMLLISCLFAKKGDVIYGIKDKNGNIIEKGVQKQNPKYDISNIKILQNGMSASASEALSLSLIQNNDAKTYGFTSYGKGIAQTFFTFNDNSVLRYTYGKVFGPDLEESIHEVGIKADFDSSKYYMDTPFYYNQCVFSNDDYMDYLSYIYENLSYLGYNKPINPEGDLMGIINRFQTDYGYTVSSIYDDEVSKQIMFETYKKIQENMENELERVVFDRY